ncbi:MAG: S-layer homology domain-containing protein [Clostridia bacterium]|nr:S-layer homology domain-containing protein [Clostridia bacterium]
MNNKPLRALSLLLAVLMLISMLPVTILADDQSTETTSTQIVIKDDSIVLAQNGLSSPDISYNESTKVTTLKMTTDVADGDNTYFTVSLADINAKKTPYIVLGASNSTPGNYDISIGYKNGYNAERDYEHKSFRLYGKTYAFSDTISNIVIDATKYTSGDTGWYDADRVWHYAGYNIVVTEDTTFDYLRIRLRNGGTVTKDSTVDIKYVAFFDTLEAAQSYVHPDDSEGTTPDTPDVPDTPSEPANYVFIPGNKLLEIASAGSVIVENNIPILKVGADKCSTSSMLKFTPNKVDLGFAATGEGSFYDYSHYVIRYKTEGDARTSDTTNLRGADASKTEREKYGGTEQVVKSDTYTYKTIDRDTFTKGSGATEAPNANWSSPWMTLKMFYGSEGAIYIDFIATFKSAEDAAEFIASVENGTFERPEYEGGEDPIDPPVEPPVTDDSDYVLIDANELLLAIGKGEVKSEKQNDYVPYIRLLSSQTNKSSFITIFPHKTTLGIADTGDGSFYDYSHYVIRYRTSGDARTSDTVNFRGYPAGNETNYEKHGGSAQVTKSDSYTIKTIARDTFLGGTVYGETPEKNWTNQYMTLKMFENADVEGYIDIDFITLCKDEATANAFIEAYENGEIEREYEKPVIPGLNTSYNPQNQTLSATLMSDASTILSPRTLLEGGYVTFSDITATLEEDNDGGEYLNLKVSPGTYGNSGAAFAICGHMLPYNLVEYKYMKFVYEADYSKTMDMSINPYSNNSFSGETWIKGASNPSASVGVEKEYILDLTKLNAKAEITSDYTNFNLVYKILGSGSKTITEQANLKIKYIGFYKTEAEANNATLTSEATASFDGYNVEALVQDAFDEQAANIEITVPVDSSITKADITLTSDLLYELIESSAYIMKLVINCGNAKVTLDDMLLSDIYDNMENEAVIELEFMEDGVFVDITEDGDSLDLTHKVRVLLNVNTYDELAVATVNGKIASDSAVVNGYPAVRALTPAEIGFETKQYKIFDDVSVHWSSDNVKFATSRKLFDGISQFEFAPNASMTRAQAAALLLRLSGESYDAYGSLIDINKNAWYAEACDWIVNLVLNYEESKFRPDEAITREELANFIYSYALYLELILDAPYDIIEFTDASDITFEEAVNFCVCTGIINGYPDDSFKPQNTVTRAEAATMIVRFINAYIKGNEIIFNDYQNVDFDEDNIVLTFIAMSDIHIDSASENQAAVNFKNAVNVGTSLAVNGNVDAIMAAGDLTQNVVYDTNDYTYEIDALKGHVDNFVDENTYFFFSTGNHDRSSTKSYESNFYDVFTETVEDQYRYYKYDVEADCEYDKGNRHAVIDGYHFLSVGMHQDYTAYLKPILDKLTKEDPFKPVFVQYHYHASNTVYSTNFSDGTSQQNLRTLLDNYPQVVFFSGHTHNGLDNPRGIWQGTFTALDTASVRYLDDNGLIRDEIKIPINATHNEVFAYASEATLVEVDADNHIRFRPYNTYRGDIVNEFIISAPDEYNTHLITYSDEREVYSMPPVFGRNQDFTLEKLDGNHIGVYFDQAEHEDIVWYYTITFEAEGEKAQKFYFTSRYFDPAGMPDAIDCTLYTDEYYVSKNDNHAGLGHKLTEGVTYTATLTAYDVWDHPSEPIMIEYKA